MEPVEQLRRTWAARQGLGKKRLAGLDALPWMYSASGACAYLSVRARFPGMTRAEIERAGLIDVPCVRSNMLVPPGDVALALAAGRRANAERFRRLSSKCKVSVAEIRDLAAAVVEVLEGGALPIDQIRQRLPARLIRNLGEPGRKLGDTSTLTVALRELQTQGRVMRDSEPFIYRLNQPPKPVEDGEIDVQLARKFFAWAGPATVEEFAWWSDLGAKAARAAVEEAEVEAFQVPDAKPEPIGLKLLPFRDNYLYFRRNLSAFLGPKHRNIKLLDFKNKLTPLAAQQTLHHHAIVFDGRLIGAWEYDPEAQDIAWTVWEEARGVEPTIERAIEEMAAFIRDEMGDLKFYALDTGKGRRLRIESLR